MHFSASLLKRSVLVSVSIIISSDSEIYYCVDAKIFKFCIFRNALVLPVIEWITVATKFPIFEHLKDNFSYRFLRFRCIKLTCLHCFKSCVMFPRLLLSFSRKCFNNLCFHKNTNSFSGAIQRDFYCQQCGREVASENGACQTPACKALR